MIELLWHNLIEREIHTHTNYSKYNYNDIDDQEIRKSSDRYETAREAFLSNRPKVDSVSHVTTKFMCDMHSQSPFLHVMRNLSYSHQVR